MNGNGFANLLVSGDAPWMAEYVHAFGVDDIASHLLRQKSQRDNMVCLGPRVFSFATDS